MFKKFISPETPESKPSPDQRQARLDAARLQAEYAAEHRLDEELIEFVMAAPVDAGGFVILNDVPERLKIKAVEGRALDRRACFRIVR
jgi:hypothetical protein